MFRRLPTSLPKDPVVPTDLEQLGYFINETDQLRMIQKPDQKYLFKINRNDRVNDIHKEVVNRCVRDIVKQRIQELGFETLRLPLGSQEDDRHVPIYISKNIASRKRVLVIFGERNQDLGVLSYRVMGEEGISIGSVLDLVQAVVSSPTITSADDTPGIIIANPGQLIWYRSEGRAISYREYLTTPRSSAVHGPFRIDPVKNRVPGNDNYAEHVHYIFENVLTKIVQPETKLDIIGLEYTGDAVVNYLAQNWDLWNRRINGICLGNPQFKSGELPVSGAGVRNSFLTFLSDRVRAYFVSDAPIETPISGRNERGCNCYASGETMYEESILVRSWRSMLDWFTMVAVLEDYAEPVFTMIETPTPTTGEGAR